MMFSSEVITLYKKYREAENKASNPWKDTQRGYKAYATRRFNLLVKSIEAENLDLGNALYQLSNLENL